MSKADTTKQLDRLLIEQSSQLLEGMQHGEDKDRQALAAWLLQSRRHVRTHLLMTALEEELKQIDPHKRLNIPDIRALEPVAPLFSKESALGGRKPRRIWMVAAAILVTLAAALFVLAFSRVAQWQQYSTVVGEQRSVTLTDGSVIQLNTGSRIKVRLSATSRDIRLLDGEAMFKVQKDRTRPFFVRTPDALIQAVGTQFNVHRLNGRTKVSVLEGRVRVSAGNQQAITVPPILGAGEEADIRQDGQIHRREAPDVKDTAAWIQRRVVFKQEPLSGVVAEFNRYRKVPRFQVDDPELAARKYSGIFDVDDPRSLEDVLANEKDVVLDRSDDAIVVRRRAQ